MLKKLYHFFTKNKSVSDSEDQTAQALKDELFLFQTKVFFEFTDLTSKIEHQEFEKRLYTNFRERKPAINMHKDYLHIPFTETDFVYEETRKIPKKIRAMITSCLAKQFENIVSAKQSMRSVQRDYHLNTYSVFRIDFLTEEYQLKHQKSLSHYEMKTLLNLIFTIERKMQQLPDPDDFASTFTDTIRTLNETTDKITAFKNADAILDILTNIKNTADAIIEEYVQSAHSLTEIEINKQTNADRIIQMELELTKRIAETRQELKELKMIR